MSIEKNKQLQLLLTELIETPWYEAVGDAIQDLAGVKVVDFAFMAKSALSKTDPWNGALTRAEMPIERLLFDNCLLDEWVEARNLVDTALATACPRSDAVLDDLLSKVDKQHSDPETGYFPGSSLYPHELFSDSNRITYGAAAEAILTEIEPSLDFFRGLMKWYQSGHIPCGWDGNWPEGKVIVW
jgi:hypothetical protein